MMLAVKNNVGREMPVNLGNLKDMKPFAGVFERTAMISRTKVCVRTARTSGNKQLPSIRAALQAANLKDGATISFHHHLRNGDAVANAVLREAASMGLTGLIVAASSIFPVHKDFVEYIRSGVVRQIYTGYVSGPVAESISKGEMAEALVMHTHGGRARLIESGKLHIDAAFIAAPTADAYGNLNGTEGPSACGTLGYAEVDARYADTVIAITDNLVPYPACPIVISQDYVDYVVVVPSIGDASQIVSGTTRPTNDPVGLEIAQTASRVIEASGLLKEGFSFQTGAGGISLAVAASLRELMHKNKIQGSFASGGITGYLVQMLNEGLFRSLLDVQCFDLQAVESYRRDPRHHAMSASMYANPHNKGAVVDQLSTMVLGAAEIDLDFNVNVTTGASGKIIGGSGGHSDTAAGAKLALVTTRLRAGNIPKVVRRVSTVTTPGESIDVLVTEYGVAVNPKREELLSRLTESGIPIRSIEELEAIAREGITLSNREASDSSKIVAVVEYRDGTIIDVVRGIPT